MRQAVLSCLSGAVNQPQSEAAVTADRPDGGDYGTVILMAGCEMIDCHLSVQQPGHRPARPASCFLLASQCTTERACSSDSSSTTYCWCSKLSGLSGHIQAMMSFIFSLSPPSAAVLATRHDREVEVTWCRWRGRGAVGQEVTLLYCCLINTHVLNTVTYAATVSPL